MSDGERTLEMNERRQKLLRTRSMVQIAEPSAVMFINRLNISTLQSSLSVPIEAIMMTYSSRKIGIELQFSEGGFDHQRYCCTGRTDVSEFDLLRQAQGNLLRTRYTRNTTTSTSAPRVQFGKL